MISDGVAVITLANWHTDQQRIKLTIDWEKLKALGVTLEEAGARVRAPLIEGFQPQGSWAASESFLVRGKGAGDNEGWLLHLF